MRMSLLLTNCEQMCRSKRLISDDFGETIIVLLSLALRMKSMRKSWRYAKKAMVQILYLYDKPYFSSQSFGVSSKPSDFSLLVFMIYTLFRNRLIFIGCLFSLSSQEAISLSLVFLLIPLYFQWKKLYVFAESSQNGGLSLLSMMKPNFFLVFLNLLDFTSVIIF